MKRELIEFFHKNADYHDRLYGKQCRCTVSLKDGIQLPCVMLLEAGPTLDLALRRFEEEREGQGAMRRLENSYRAIVANFVTSGNQVNNHDIASVEPSPYAIPHGLRNEIHSETVMGYTGWVFEMSDGKRFSFGSAFSFEFFDLPDDYRFEDVVKVYNHSYAAKDGSVYAIRDDKDHNGKLGQAGKFAHVYRERPYFVCYVDARGF